MLSNNAQKFYDKKKHQSKRISVFSTIENDLMGLYDKGLTYDLIWEYAESEIKNMPKSKNSLVNFIQVRIKKRKKLAANNTQDINDKKKKKVSKNESSLSNKKQYLKVESDIGKKIRREPNVILSVSGMLGRGQTAKQLIDNLINNIDSKTPNTDDLLFEIILLEKELEIDSDIPKEVLSKWLNILEVELAELELQNQKKG